MEYNLQVTKNTHNKVILSILNFNFKLSDLETDMVASMLKYNITVINKESRLKIGRDVSSERSLINNYILRLKDKGILVTKAQDKKLYVNPSLLALRNSPNLSFKFTVSNDN